MNTIVARNLAYTDGEALLRIARFCLEMYVGLGASYRPDPEEWPPALQQPAATFVTLSQNGKLRGLTGVLEPRWSLMLDVALNTVAAATRDAHQEAVRPEEVGDLRVGITVLTPVQPVPYDNYGVLLAALRPHEDGLILSWDKRQAVLLPQVWQHIPKPEAFLAALCHKAGVPLAELHRVPPAVTVQRFGGQCFCERGYVEPAGDLL